MSGIAGAILADGRAMTSDLVGRVAQSTMSRGFDGTTMWHDGTAGFVRFAHATTIEARGEVQPFIGTESRIALLFDGRLDNRGDLLGLLGPRGAALSSAPDGQIALALFERFDRNFIHHLVGDYAIAVWQPAERRLSLFRSPLGWRPLLWAYDGRTFGFATEPRALILGLGFARKLNEGTIGEYLAARFVTETETLWAGIERVPQGAAVIFDKGRVSTWAWHGGPFEDLSRLSLADHVDRFNALFDTALVAATRSDGPVTSQLSGGLDSSSIVCRATQLHRAGIIDRQLGAITARFPGEPHDESAWSGAVEAHLGITAEVVGAQAFDADAARQWCADSYQLPLRPNVLDTMAGVCSALQADGRRVLLTGEGGDDWLNGSFAHWPDLLRSGRWATLFRHGAEQWPTSPLHVKARRTLYPALMPLISAKHREGLLRPHLDYRLGTPGWLRPEWMKRIGLEERWRAELPRPGLRGMDQQSRYSVFSHARRYTNLDTVHAYTEQRGIEIRHPLHDLRLTRFFMGASGVHLRKYDERKHLLREAMRGVLPEVIRTRKTKAYFVGHTIDAVDALFAERAPREMRVAQLGWVDGDAIEALHAPYAKWRREGSTGPLPTGAWGPVWFALATDMWLDHAFKL